MYQKRVFELSLNEYFVIEYGTNNSNFSIPWFLFLCQAAAVVDHLSQNDPTPAKKVRISLDGDGKKSLKNEAMDEPTVKIVISFSSAFSHL